MSVGLNINRLLRNYSIPRSTRHIHYTFARGSSGNDGANNDERVERHTIHGDFSDFYKGFLPNRNAVLKWLNRQRSARAVQNSGVRRFGADLRAVLAANRDDGAHIGRQMPDLVNLCVQRIEQHGWSSSSVLLAMVRAAARYRLHGDVHEQLDALSVQHNDWHTAIAYTELCCAYVRDTGDIAAAMKVLRETEARGIVLRASALHTLLANADSFQASSTGGTIVKALKRSLQNEARWELFDELLEYARRNAMDAMPRTFSSALRAFARLSATGGAKNVQTIYEECRERVGERVAPPNADAAQCLLTQSRSAREIAFVFTLCAEHNLSPNNGIYMHALEACVRAADTALLASTLDSARSVLCADAWNRVLRYMLHKEEADCLYAASPVLTVWLEMHASWLLSSNRTSRALLRQRWEPHTYAHQFWHMMACEGVVPNARMFATYIHLCGTAYADVHRISLLLGSALEAERGAFVVYRAAVDAFVRCDRAECAWIVWRLYWEQSAAQLQDDREAVEAGTVSAEAHAEFVHDIEERRHVLFKLFLDNRTVAAALSALMQTKLFSAPSRTWQYVDGDSADLACMDSFEAHALRESGALRLSKRGALSKFRAATCAPKVRADEVSGDAAARANLLAVLDTYTSE